MPSEQTPPFDGKAFVSTLTSSPGVYRHLDAAGELLYVGKANNLKKRVGSYFLKPRMEPRIAAMVAQIASVEITVTRTEGEALLLESQLIKSLKPRYNILLRDDKSYPYIYLSGGEDYPRLAFHRGARNLPGRYFGPYPSTYAVRESLSLMQKLFKVRQCEDSYFRNRSRPCLQHQIGRCTAPCVGLISVDDYRTDVRHAEMFLEGRSNAVIDELGAAMEQASTALQFERAAKLRDQVAALRQLQAQHHVQGASADMDVIACRIESGIACISVLFFRNGISLGTRDFFPRLPLDAEPADDVGGAGVVGNRADCRSDQHHRQPDHDLAPRAPADQRVDEQQNVDHRVEAETRGPACQGRQSQRHRDSEAHHDARQRLGTPPEQHRREPDRHDRHERPPGHVVTEDSLEQRRHHQRADQCPVARQTFRNVRGAGLGPQRAQGVGDHPPSVGTAETTGIDRKNETPLLPTAEEGPASTPMCARRGAARVVT